MRRPRAVLLRRPRAVLPPPGPPRVAGLAAAPALAIAACLLVAARPGSADAQDAERGRAVYEAWCAECHGAEGAGDGPAADRMLPRPRDFAAARYQVRTTGSGELPTDADLLRVIREGIPGTTMPSWPNLRRSDQRAVVAYIKSLSPFFEGPPPEPMAFADDPGGGSDAVESGQRAYRTLECAKCHGEAGRGDGSSAPTLEDWRGFPIRAADLTEPWSFNGGSSAADIHARVLTGLDGTPMPSAIDALQAAIVSEDEVWHLAHYVSSLAPVRAPRVRDVVRVRRAEAEGELPGGPDDPAWDDLEAFWFPLAGQVIRTPRQFAPTVDGIWVEGAHDGSEVVLRLSWNDPSRSPDPAWDEWQERIAAALFADGEEIPTDPLPDALAVQFPFEIPEGNERPYFLMGSGRDPVYLWRWDSQNGVSEDRAAGLGVVERLEGGGLTGQASFADGRWRLVLRRSLEAAGGAGLAFREGVAIPVAFFAWDGSSGETGMRGSISTWYYLFLEEPRSPAVLVVPLLAVVLTGGLSLLAVRRARSRWEG